MFTRNLKFKGKLFAAILIATGWIGPGIVGVAPVQTAGACAFAPDERDPSVKILRCGDNLTVRAAHGARYRPVYARGLPLPTAVRLDSGAILIEFHPSADQDQFQILAPLAIAAVRGTKWAMEVTSARNSTLVLSGMVAVTNRRLSQYVNLSDGEGVDITPNDSALVRKRWGEARVRALLSRFGE